MRIALVADLHGNRAATLALEKDLQTTRPDRIICLGDVVGKGPCSDFTFDWAFANCDLIVGGNWDFGVAKKMFPKDEPYWTQLGPERMQKLSQLPTEAELMLSGRSIRLIHGRPIMKELIGTGATHEQIDPLFIKPDGSRWDVVAFADAHRHGMRTINPGLFINSGSVGNALGVPLCCYALLEGEEGTEDAPFEVRFRQVGYDKALALQDAALHPDIPRIDTFIREIQTGLYSR
ncbi:MAG: metallophosphoesterase family protein [Clostridiales bacterium]|nr:metallophosphoesterase family protein [Clostridiales bacterium]